MIDALGLGTRDLLTRQSLGDAFSGGIATDAGGATASGGGGGGGGKTQSDPANFHLTTGPAALCLFYTLALSLIFHMWRWWSPFPPPHPGSEPDPDGDEDEENMVPDGKGGFKKKSWFRRRGQKLDGVKRFGYRVSKGFTILNVCLLTGVMFGSIMMATSSGFGNGTARESQSTFVLDQKSLVDPEIVIIIALVLLVLVAYIEHLGAKGMIGRLLLKGQGRLYVPKRIKTVVDPVQR